jgi:hypothetical protein
MHLFSRRTGPFMVSRQMYLMLLIAGMRVSQSAFAAPLGYFIITDLVKPAVFTKYIPPEGAFQTSPVLPAATIRP